jgi:secreted PhoX family phosphatase
VPNESDNPYFGDVLGAALSRRGLLKAGATTALVVGAGQLAGAGAAAASAAAPAGARPVPGGALTFVPVPPNTLDELVVPVGYDYRVLVRWGDPIVAGAPAFDPYAQTAAKQAMQFGYNCDYLTVLRLDADRALMVVNHEYTNEELMFPGVTSPSATTTLEQRRVAMMAHGLSVVTIERVGTSAAWRCRPTCGATGVSPRRRRSGSPVRQRGTPC